jgi:hypothetical protein
MNEKHEQFKLLRKEALQEAREVLGPKLLVKYRQGKFNFDANRAERNQSIMHKLMSVEEIEYRINNNLPIDDLYERDGSKFQRDKNVSKMWDGEEFE